MPAGKVLFPGLFIRQGAENMKRGWFLLMLESIRIIMALLGIKSFGWLFTVFRVIGILLLAFIAIKVGAFIIRKALERHKSFKYGLDRKKVDTLSTLLVSLLKYAVYILAAVVILADVLNLKSVLAAASIGGIAIGFGAQSLIKDVLAGFFIVLEDQYSVGDTVTVGGLSGTVEKMELRVTKLRSLNGDLHIIPNGEIVKVTNHTRGNRAVIVDIPLAYNVAVGKAIETAEAVCREVSKEFSRVLVKTPSVLGITEMGKGSFTLRIFAMALPNEQPTVERRIRLLIKEAFDREGIELR